MTMWTSLAKLRTLAVVVAFVTAWVTAAVAGEVIRQEVQIVARAVMMESNTLRVSEGDRVELTWISDQSVKLHLHGYDIKLMLEPGVPGLMAVDATTAGRFPVSHHGFGDDHAHGENALIYLEVYPE